MADSPFLSARVVLILLVIATLLAFLLHVGYGSSSFVSPWGVLEELFKGPVGGRANDTVWQIRLSRGIACLLLGGTLGAVGSAFQALFRNPLADPYVVGVSSGAAVGGVFAEIAGFGAVAGGLGKDLGAFIGGMLSLGIVLLLAGRAGATNVTKLLLAGVVVGSMLGGLLSLAILASGHDANMILRWLLGDTSNLMWPTVAALAVVFVAGSAVLVLQARSLNAFAIGEETARRLGVKTQTMKAVVLIAGTAMTAVTVGSAGVIAFMGMVAPHIARGLLGVDWRRSLVGSIVVGAGLLVIADALTQRVIPDLTSAMGYTMVTDLPVGVVTALIGAPSLIILLRRPT